MSEHYVAFQADSSDLYRQVEMKFNSPTVNIAALNAYCMSRTVFRTGTVYSRTTFSPLLHDWRVDVKCILSGVVHTDCTITIALSTRIHFPVFRSTENEEGKIDGYVTVSVVITDLCKLKVA